jgi:hypothetical protein
MRFLAPCEQPQDGVVGKAGHDVQGFGRSGRVRYLGNCNAGTGSRAGAGSQRQHRRNGQGRQRRTRRIELFFEAKNLFNTENVATVTRDVTTSATGDLSAPLPSPFPPQSAYDQRQMQLGLKFAF